MKHTVHARKRLPVHPKTGLLAVGVRANGEPIWPVMGGDRTTAPPVIPGRSITLSHGQTVTRMEEIRDEIELLYNRDELTDADEEHWHELRDEFEALDDHRRQLERDADRAHILSVARDRQAGRPTGGARIERGAPDGGEPGGSLGDDYDYDPVGDPRSAYANEGKRFRNPWDLSTFRVYGRSGEQVAAEYTARAHAAVERMTGANDRIRSAAASIMDEFDDNKATIARQMLATSDPLYLSAWVKMARGAKHLLDSDEKAAIERAMSLTTTAGGFLIPFQLDPTVIITANGSRNQIRQVARQVVATGNLWNGISSGAVSWSWDAEAAEVSDDATTFAQPTVALYKGAGFIPISIEAIEDEANVTGEVARLLAFGRDVLESAAFATGTGSGQPFGVVTALIGGGSEVASTTADAFASGDVYKLDSALPARYRANAAWLANRAIYNLVRQFDTGGGAQMWERIGADVPPMLLGRPALESEDMDGSVTGATTNYLLVYGDFENYVIADRIGMQVDFIPHLVGTNRRPTGQRGWYAYYRVGANVVNSGGFRMLNA